VITSPCAECHGEGQIAAERRLQIKIPPGVDTGSQLRISGEGEGGAAGGPPGDLYVVLRVQEHAFFRREAATLFCEIPISVTQAVLGAALEVPTVDGGQAKVAIPEGTQSGASFRVRGQGVPHLGSKGRGDLHVSVRVVMPTKLSAEQRKLFEQLDKSLPTPELKPKERSFLHKMKDILG
jgi:molecular chaperone DnaJ